MIDMSELRRLAQAAQPEKVSELLARLESAESEVTEQARLNGAGAERELALMAKLEAAEKERDELRAKIAEMKQQEPVGTVEWIKGWPVVNAYEGVVLEPDKPLYALPGAKGEEK